MKLKIKEGTTSKLVRVFVQDSSATDGSGLTGLVYNSASLTAYYIPEGDASATAITLATMTVGTWATGGFKEVDATNMPGVYEIGLPDAVVDATSEGSVVVMLKGATNMAPVVLELELDAVDYKNATVWDAFDDQYDGVTGLSGDTYPATQSQLDGIANVGSAVHKPASSYTLTTGTQSANLYTDTEALNGVRHTHTDTAGVMSLEYHFLIGGGTPSSVQVTGYVTGGNDDIDVMGYDWVTTSYKQIGNIDGSNSTSNSVYSFDLFVDMVGSGADEGKVDIQFIKSSGLTSATLAIDQVFVAFNQGAEGYDGGAVWFNSNASNTNTVVGIDGTSRNPVSTSAALLTLLASTGLKKIECTPGSTLTLGAAYEGYTINGNGSVLALNSQDIGASVWERFSSVTGVGTTSANPAFFEDCIFGTATIPPSVVQQCGFGGTLTIGSAGDVTVVDGYSVVAGAGSPTFTKTAGQAVTLEYRRLSGGITQSGLESGDVVTIGGVDLGTVTLNGADASVEIRGIKKATVNNLTGNPTVNDTALLKSDISTAAAIADAVWDEVQSGHTTAGTFGKYLDSQVSSIGSAVGPGSRALQWTIRDTGETPIPGVKTWISTDSPYTTGGTIAGTLTTDDNGIVDYLLDEDVVYYCWRDISTFNFTDPLQIRYSSSNGYWEIWNGAAYVEWT